MNMKIFIDLKDLHAELPSLTMLDFFLSVFSVTMFGTCPVTTCSQLIWLRLGPLLQECKRITRLTIQSAFYFMKDECRKRISVNAMDIILIMNKIRKIFK